MKVSPEKPLKESLEEHLKEPQEELRRIKVMEWWNSLKNHAKDPGKSLEEYSKESQE